MFWSRLQHEENQHDHQHFGVNNLLQKIGFDEEKAWSTNRSEEMGFQGAEAQKQEAELKGQVAQEKDGNRCSSTLKQEDLR